MNATRQIAASASEMISAAEAEFESSFVDFLLGQRAPARHAAPFSKSDAGRARRADRRAAIARKWEYVLGD